MLMNTNKTTARWKEWIPLCTQQLRLRSLVQILALNIETNGTKRNQNTKTCYYFTLHSTMMSPPFYTSEKIPSENAKWSEIEWTEFRGKVYGSENAVIIRLWCTTATDQAVAVWCVHLNGLAYIGPKLNTTLLVPMSNIIIFQFPGGYFTDPKCILQNSQTRLINTSINYTDVRHSYTVKLLSRLHNLQQVIYKQNTVSEQLKEKIAVGGFIGNESRADTLLRRLMSKDKPKVQRQELLAVKKKIEEAKFRNNLLQHEKNILTLKCEQMRKSTEALSDENEEKECLLYNNYRLLNKEVEAFKEWRIGHNERRDVHIHSRALLNYRCVQLASELSCIYPIQENLDNTFTICGVYLPHSEDFAGRNEMQLSVALGYVAHVLQMISYFLQVPLRYPVIHFGSRSSILDEISNMLPDKDREFPLHSMSRDKFPFEYGVYLLNRNIAQLRWCFGYSTSDLRNTLSNLVLLVKPKEDMRGSDNSSPAFHSHSDTTSHFQFHPDSDPPTFTHPQGYRQYRSDISPKDLAWSKFRSGVVNNNLSYSLDKGLNVYKDSKDRDSVTASSTSQLDALADERNSTMQVNIISHVAKEEKELFLKNWEESRKNVILSDEDSEEPTFFPVENVRPHLLNIIGDSVSMGSIEQTSQVIMKPDSKGDSDKVFTDSLLANVASRTEALANQPTLFNRFKSRFGSALES